MLSFVPESSGYSSRKPLVVANKDTRSALGVPRTHAPASRSSEKRPAFWVGSRSMEIYGRMPEMGRASFNYRLIGMPALSEPLVDELPRRRLRQCSRLGLAREAEDTKAKKERIRGRKVFFAFETFSFLSLRKGVASSASWNFQTGFH